MLETLGDGPPFPVYLCPKDLLAVPWSLGEGYVAWEGQGGADTWLFDRVRMDGI